MVGRERGNGLELRARHHIERLAARLKLGPGGDDPHIRRLAVELAGHLRQDERHVITGHEVRPAGLEIGNARLAAGDRRDLDG